MRASGKTYHPTIDANGNVIVLWDADTAEVAAYYDYDPFGKTVRATGPAAEVSPFRFSTKYQDVETGFYYYGYRYYSPGMGRWLNRDPIEEQGGLDLYAMVGNDPVNRWDYLGLASVALPPGQLALIQLFGVEEAARMLGLSAVALAAMLEAHEVATAAQDKIDDFAKSSRGRNDCERAKETLRRLRESLQKHQNKLAEHEQKIANPRQYVTDQSRLSNPHYMRGIVEFWQKEIDTKFKPQIRITNSAIDLAQKAVDVACCRWWNPFTW